MSNFEVGEPILNSPFEEPQQHWWIVEGEIPVKREGRRFAHYFYRDPRAASRDTAQADVGTMIELKLVTRIRERLAGWRSAGYPGASRTTQELLAYWSREGRGHPLFFAQLEAAATVIFLTEARADFRQGIDIPRDEPSADRKAEGYKGFLRYACKMATGSGKSTVMAMLAAWSILNKQADRSDARFSDVVLIVCPNVTIRDRLGELNPETGDASLYRTRDLVPPHLMSLIAHGKVFVTNWHVFEPQTPQVAGDSGKVIRAGVAERRVETIIIGEKTTTARGKRYLTQADFERQVAAGLLTVLEEDRDRSGNLVKSRVESVRYLESDTALVERVLEREIGGKRNLLVLNDEAHHAYRIRRDEPDEDEDEDDELDEFYSEATVWIEGLDKIQKQRGINFCVDFSATPYYLGRVGQDTNRPFPWVVCDFGLIDAIESGLVKIPQLAVRDTTGSSIPGYFNIWHWILPQLTTAEKGGRKAAPKPEAILKYAHTPIAMLAGLWEEEWRRKQSDEEDRRPPVFIIVCKNTQIARVLYEWIAQDQPPPGIPHSKIESFRNGNGTINTIRVDSKVVRETDTGEAKSDESRWMRFTLDTVGKTAWPTDALGRAVYPDDFVELAEKLGRPLHPPGRDIRCIVSVGMLTEGWDCNTVTHIVGLRPFMSQLLCEQVVGRGLRRTRYALNDDGKFSEETAKVFGVPFQIIPFKANAAGAAPAPAKRWHVHALPAKSMYEIRFPRVEGYTQAIRNRIAVNWHDIPRITVDPQKIPPEVQLGRLLPSVSGRLSVLGPGKSEEATLDAYRAQRRLQELKFDLAQALVQDCVKSRRCEVPAHALFPQLLGIVERYLGEKVKVQAPADLRDVFLAPYYTWVVERLTNAIGPDTAEGEAPEMPRYEARRGAGSTAEVDFWTGREPREVVRSHVNFMVSDTKRWEQSAAYLIDTHPKTQAFVKNAGLGFAIPYVHNGQTHEYLPDFIIRLEGNAHRYLIAETKGFDELEEVKREAAERWANAVNAEGSFGRWRYRVAKQVSDIPGLILSAAGA
ncbi:MAG: DEAD/DEAH box helicase family protein [Betaproteobacteria bacterium]|nr:DEAD/DEAH box helicase family protein [Betaproteobacteria bacterium]